MVVSVTTARQPSASFLPSFQTEIDTTHLPFQLSTSNCARDVDLIADTGPIDWDEIDSDHSGQEAHAVEAGRSIKISFERELQAAHSKNLRREAD